MEGIMFAGATSRLVPTTRTTELAITALAAAAMAPTGRGSPKSTTSALRTPPQPSCLGT